MTAQQIMILVLVAESILYLLLCILALGRSSLREGGKGVLVLYAAISCFWVLQQLAGRLGWFNALGINALGINAYVLVRVPIYGLVLLSMLFLYLTRSFLRLDRWQWGWLLLGLAWIGALVLLDSGARTLLDSLMLTASQIGDPGTLTFALAIAAWALFMVVSARLFIGTYRRTPFPLHRNRIKYWQMAWAVTLSGDLLFFGGQEILGGGIRLLGTLIAAYVVLTHRLPDVRRTTRRVLNYLLLTLLTVAIYTAGFTAVQYLFQDIPGYSPLWAGAAVALVLAVFFHPLLGLVQRLVNRLIAGIRYDPSSTVSEYSLRISNIVSLERLATVVIELIGAALEIQRGELFVVHYERDGQGEIFRLEGIRRLGAEDALSGTLSGDGPVTRHLRESRQPLTQYDIDLLPEFRSLAEPERAWLANLGMDVYVPIHAQGSWIGLLGLGPKVSGDRYYGDDLALLGTLSDQTAVALENARLVSDLIELNQDLEQAYATLAGVNRQLQEMDRIKSAFIGVITHELRTPFANIAFSLQIFKRQGLEALSPEQREQLERLAAGLQEAKMMIDNLITFATFLSKQGDLRLEQVDFRNVLRDTLAPLKSVADTKGLTIHPVVSDEMPPLQGDRGRLADAVHHLVHNAIKFTASGGEIWIRSQPTEGAILFEVRDSGVGIPADRLPDLWDGFTQMADPLRRGVEGLGLGLALVHYIVRAHGGRVWASSEEGVGSTFGFEIPLEGPQGVGRSLQPGGGSAAGDAI